MVVLPSSLVDALAAALPLPVIAWLFGPAAAGQFALVWRVAALPGGLIGASVGDVFHAHATGARDGGPEQVRRLLRDTLRMLVLVALLIYVPLCLVAPWVFPWIFGEPWGVAGQMMLYLAPMWIASMVVSPVSRLPVVLGRPGLKFVFDLCFLVRPIAALSWPGSRGSCSQSSFSAQPRPPHTACSCSSSTRPPVGRPRMSIRRRVRPEGYFGWRSGAGRGKSRPWMSPPD